MLLTGAIEGTGANHLESMFNEAEDALDNTISGSGTLHRSKSQPDFLQQLNENQASIFSRPDLGSFAFGKSIRNFVVAEPTVDDKSSIESRYEDDVDLLDSDNSDDDVELSAIERFLTACGLGEYLPRFEDQKIDLDTLMILTETDLKTLGLPLGHFRKLVNGINERKGALENPGDLTDGTVWLRRIGTSQMSLLYIQIIYDCEDICCINNNNIFTNKSLILLFVKIYDFKHAKSNKFANIKNISFKIFKKLTVCWLWMSLDTVHVQQ